MDCLGKFWLLRCHINHKSTCLSCSNYVHGFLTCLYPVMYWKNFAQISGETIGLPVDGPLPPWKGIALWIALYTIT
jgi:hypothetical protein